MQGSENLFFTIISNTARTRWARHGINVDVAMSKRPQISADA
jgi:hypothetical protein